MRTPDELQTEYQKLCVQLGDLASQKRRLERIIERLESDILRLDEEYLQVTRIPKEDTIVHPIELENPQETKAP